MQFYSCASNYLSQTSNNLKLMHQGHDFSELQWLCRLITEGTAEKQRSFLQLYPSDKIEEICELLISRPITGERTGCTVCRADIGDLARKPDLSLRVRHHLDAAKEGFGSAAWDWTGCCRSKSLFGSVQVMSHSETEIRLATP